MKTSKISNSKAPTFDELKDFTLKSYAKFLRYLNRVYKIVPFCEIPREDIPYLILRHDIDVSLLAALKMAQIERDLGIKSTYFVLFSNRFYNFLEENNVDILKQISRLGHEIGLHYYPAQYRSYNQNLKKTLKIEIQLLEHLLGKKVHSISQHGSWDRDPFATTKEYYNANHPHFRKDLFVHESCRAWTPLQGIIKLLNDPPKRVQLLTHPENWQKDKIDRKTLLDKFFQNLDKEISAFKSRYEKKWLTDPLVLQYDALVRKGENMQTHKKGHTRDGTNSKMGIQLRQQLSYYNAQVRWYIINNSLGWRIHKIITEIRNII